LRGWYPIEILHFPVRSLEQCLRKYVTQFVALERNAEKGIPDHMAEAYEAYRAGRLEDFYRPLVVDDRALAEGLRSGNLTLDTRLRDVLAGLGFGEGAAGARTRPSAIDDGAAFAAECSALDEADLGLAFGARVEDLERRIAALEQTLARRMRAALGRARP
jgi:hypothetical protein